MSIVRVREGESAERAYWRLKDLCRQSGVLVEAKKRRYYEKPSQAKRRKARAAQRRLAKKIKALEEFRALKAPGC